MAGRGFTPLPLSASFREKSMGVDNNNDSVAIQSHIQRVKDLADALKAAKTPPECNGFARLMRDSTVILLRGEEIRMEMAMEPVKPARQWNMSKAVAVVGSALITNTAVVVSILEIVKAVADKN